MGLERDTDVDVAGEDAPLTDSEDVSRHGSKEGLSPIMNAALCPSELWFLVKEPAVTEFMATLVVRLLSLDEPLILRVAGRLPDWRGEFWTRKSGVGELPASNIVEGDIRNAGSIGEWTGTSIEFPTIWPLGLIAGTGFVADARACC